MATLRDAMSNLQKSWIYGGVTRDCLLDRSKGGGGGV